MDGEEQYETLGISREVYGGEKIRISLEGQF